MPMYTKLCLGTLLLGLVGFSCSHQAPSTKETSSSQGSSDGKYTENSPIKSENAPEGGHSCRHYDPLTNAIYTGEGSAEKLEKASSPMAARNYLEAMFHGVHHARQWNDRVKAYAANHDVQDATRADVVRQVIFQRIRDAGSTEAYVRLRLQEESEAKRTAWKTANEHPKFDLPAESVSKAELTDDEIDYHRRATKAHVEDLLAEKPALFE